MASPSEARGGRSGFVVGESDAVGAVLRWVEKASVRTPESRPGQAVARVSRPTGSFASLPRDGVDDPAGYRRLRGTGHGSFLVEGGYLQHRCNTIRPDSGRGQWR